VVSIDGPWSLTLELDPARVDEQTLNRMGQFGCEAACEEGEDRQHAFHCEAPADDAMSAL
jgi:hypothetical protein